MQNCAARCAASRSTTISRTIPAAIRETIAGLRQRRRRAMAASIAVFEPRSNTLKQGVLKDALPGSFAGRDQVYIHNAGLSWDARRGCSRRSGAARALRIRPAGAGRGASPPRRATATRSW